METRKILLSIVVCAFVLMLSINMAQAADATAATLHTTDADGNDRVQFALSETVYIRWTADGTVDIRVEYEDGTPDGQWSNQPSTGVITYTPTKGVGHYAVYCTGADVRLIAYGMIMLVVPEVPLGTIMATVACFGALFASGMVKLGRRHHF